ncbi:olfactory receptor 52K1-like [Discoglossus pictus]
MNPNQSNSFSHTDFILFGFSGLSNYRQLLAIPFLIIYVIILNGNCLIIYRIWVEKSLQAPMYILISVLFAVNISCATAIVPNMLLGLLFGLDHISLGGCLFQMFFIYTAVMFESNVLLVMALDRYVAICNPLRYYDIMTKSLLVQLSIIGFVECSLFASPIIIVAAHVNFCRSNIILNFACENMVLLNLGCGDTSKIQIVGLMVRIIVTAIDITFLLVSYLKILYTAMKIIIGKDRHKTLHTCSTHLLVVTLNYSCGLLSSIAYRMTISVDVQNLSSAIYYLVPATVHPIIYGVRVKEIKDCLLKLWKTKQYLVLPFLSIYVLILTGNGTIIHRIWVEKSLQSPMYYLISLLFVVNITCTTSMMPKCIIGLAFGMNQITLGGCLMQMFFIYATVTFESTVVLIMAFDRYVAICRPLRYHDIMTNRLLIFLILISLARCVILVSPSIILVYRVHFCGSNVILNFACENMGLLKLGCGDMSRAHVIGLIIRIFITVGDISILFCSYMNVLYTGIIRMKKGRSKALNTCGTHLIVAVMIYSCGLVSALIYRVETKVSIDFQNLTSAVYYLFPSAINPFIYGLRMKEIRVCLERSFGRKKLKIDT